MKKKERKKAKPRENRDGESKASENTNGGAHVESSGVAKILGNH